MSINFTINHSSVIEAVRIIEPSVSTDIRGNIWSSFILNDFQNLLPKDISFCHDKFSSSKKNVLRGIHGDSKSWKLVTCVYGKILQVVVDLRKDSETYRKWESFIINHNSPKLILIPPNFGNAYYVYSKNAVYHYKLAYKGKYIDSKDQFTLSWNDEHIGVKWPTDNPILSERDSHA